MLDVFENLFGLLLILDFDWSHGDCCGSMEKIPEDTLGGCNQLKMKF